MFQLLRGVCCCGLFYMWEKRGELGFVWGALGFVWSVPCMGYDDVVKGGVATAEARKPQFDDHFEVMWY